MDQIVNDIMQGYRRTTRPQRRPVMLCDPSPTRMAVPAARVARHPSLLAGALVALLGCAGQGTHESAPAAVTAAGAATDDLSPQTLAEGRQIFRDETFGDEQFWTDTARMHEVVQRSVSPRTALA